MAMKQGKVSHLAEQLVQALTEQRAHGIYPLTLNRLGQIVEPGADTRALLAAVHPMRKAFSQHAVVARADGPAPVALLADLVPLAGSPLLLEYVLGFHRTASNHVASLATLKKRLTTRLQKPFQQAVERQIEEGTLPPTVGWVLANRSKVLFLLEDLHTSRKPAQPTALPASVRPVAEESVPVSPTDFAQAFQAAFDQLDRQAGAHNFVSLVDLRRELSCPRTVFDAGLRQLRREGRYSLSAAEGRHGLAEVEREAGIPEDGALLLYASRRSP